jgi:hypothetical protein
VGCGGSSGGFDETPDGGDGTTPDAITISLAISDSTVTGAAPVTVTATVMQGSTAIVNRAVTFSTTLATFSPSSGSALTNDSGVATITLTAGSVRGAGEVSASISSGESSTAPLGFASQGDDIGVVGDISIAMQLVDSDGNASSTITASKPGKVLATIDGISIPVIVTFSSTVGSIPIATAITDSNNQASVDIFAGGTLGAGEVTASINSGESGKVLLVVGSSTVEMGSGTPFVEGQADISLAQISAGGTTVVSVRILDDQGNLFTEAVDVNFTSGCTSLSTATATLSSPITTSNGIATSTYLAKGCVGDDPINVTANAGGINLSASGIVNVLPADVGSIEFVSATPENISILGTGILGGSESSTVVFRVLDTNSNPVNNQMVDFSLNTNVGGVNLIPTSATTDNNGLVQTVINSGTVATSVRVQATITDSSPSISSQSSLLVVSTGIPDQDSFTLSASTLNPEAWDIAGAEVTITARMADAFNNPVPNGTAVSFTTEGGAIEPSCTTSNGVCSVIWRSQQPRPEGHKLGDINNLNHRPEAINTMGPKFGGRATILATAIGEESFPDTNGNGRFDAAEMAAFLGTNVSGELYDLKEAFVDHNEDGLFNPAEAGGQAGGELEVPGSGDFNANGVFDLDDNLYKGVLCSSPTHVGCSTEQNSLNVRGSLVLVMSTSAGLGVITGTFDAVAATIDHDNDANTPEIANPDLNSTDNTLYIAGESTGTVSYNVADLHNQPMAAGTVITASATVGSVVNGGSFIWPNDNHNGGVSLSVGIKGETDPISGTLFLTAESPSGLISQLGSVSIVIK